MARKTKKYATVSQMVRETAGDRDFADTFDERLAARELVKDLTALRAARGFSQKDIGEKLGCTQSRISKLEASIDDDLRLGDLAGYLDAIGYHLVIVLEAKGATRVNRVKRYAFQIKKETGTAPPRLRFPS